MHIIFQFPVVDFRSLLEGENVRLSKPVWPNPDVNKKQFIRDFGKVKQRFNGGDDNWSAEDYFCDARASVKYSDLHKHRLAIGPSQNVIALDCYRRFYSDGKFMNKFELGFIDDLERRSDAVTQPISLVSVIKHYADMNVRIGDRQIKLYEAGRLLAKSYCSASTITKKMYDELQTYVVDGQLCITIILSAASNIEVPTMAKKISNYTIGTENIEHFGYTFCHGGSSIKVWILKVPRQIAGAVSIDPLATKLRKLRINLLRIHAEKETIRILLNGINSNLIKFDYGSQKATLVEDYLKGLSETLFKKKRLDTEQKEILDFALESDNVVSPGNVASLWKTVKGFNSTFAENNINKLVGKMRSSNRKVILFIASTPQGKNPLDIGAELTQIDKALLSSADRDNYEIKTQLSVMRNELLSLLNRHRPDYIHVVLHTSKIDGLYFKDVNGKALGMSIADFAEIIGFYSAKKKPEVVLLSTCNSKGHAAAIGDCCDYAMGTNNVFPERAGIEYARNFYEILFNDNNTDIPYCHQAGILGIKQANPTIQPIRETPVFTIPELFENKS